MTPEERDALILQYVPAARKLVGKFTLCRGDFEDDVQAAMVGVIYAVDHYKPDRGANLTTFVFDSIRKHLYRRWVTNNDVHLPQYLFDNVEDKGELKSKLRGTDLDKAFSIGVRSNAYDRIVARESVRKLLRLLTPEERTVVEGLYGINAVEPMTYREVAGLLRKSHTVVYFRITSAMAKMQEFVGSRHETN